MSCTQRKIIMNAFISSQFNYCPLIWMGHDRTIHKQMNRIHHRALSIVYSDYTSSVETLLEKSGSVTIHLRNIQKLAIEIFKAQNNLSPSFMSEIFTTKKTKYNLRACSSLLYAPHTSTYGRNSISFLVPNIWNAIPAEIKDSSGLHIFKKHINKWIPEPCPCSLCKTYISNLGFI